MSEEKDERRERMRSGSQDNENNQVNESIRYYKLSWLLTTMVLLFVTVLFIICAAMHIHGSLQNNNFSMPFRQQSEVEGTALVECPAGFKQSKGKCIEAFLSACSSVEPCPGDLVCQDLRCQCRYADQEYLPVTFTCLSRIDGPCGQNLPCIKHAICQPINNSSSGVCKCAEGGTRNARRKCEFQYPIDCHSKEDCNTQAGFNCIDGSCVCEGFGVYRSEEKSCVRLVGSSCKAEVVKPSCVQNSRCEYLDGVFHGHGDSVCKCIPGYQPTSNFTCEQKPTPAKIESSDRKMLFSRGASNYLGSLFSVLPIVNLVFLH